MRCTTLLNALAWLTCEGGTTAMPPVMIGIMHRPIPAARSVSSHITDELELSTVVVQQIGADRGQEPDRRRPARPDPVVELTGDGHRHGHHQRLREQEQARLKAPRPWACWKNSGT